MKLYKYIDTILIIIVCTVLCIFVNMRIVTKEILIDELGLSVPGADYILYDLNTTVEMPGNAGLKTGFSYVIEKCKYKLSAYTTSAMAYNQKINTIVNRVDNQLVNVPTAYSSRRYVSGPSENVIDFASLLNQSNVPFLYIQTPSYNSILCREGYRQLHEDVLSERSWYMLQNLNEAGIGTIDFAQELANIGFKDYDASNHWFPSGALYSASVLSQHLNQYGFEFEPALFDQNRTWDFLQMREDWTKVIYENCGYQYSYPIPDCTKNMLFELEHEGIVINGRYEDVFLRIPDKFTTNAYHDFSSLTNSTLYRLHNVNTAHNAGKRILVIGDSFNWVLSAYLIIDIEYIDVIHNASYVSDIKEYIDDTEPDLVLVVYNDAEFSDIYTEQAFDFN